MQIAEPFFGEKIRRLLGATTLLTSENDLGVWLEFCFDAIDELGVHSQADASISTDHDGNVGRIRDMTFGKLLRHANIEILESLIGLQQIVSLVRVDALDDHKSSPIPSSRKARLNFVPKETCQPIGIIHSKLRGVKRPINP